jgi:hypothetical protein
MITRWFRNIILTTIILSRAFHIFEMFNLTIFIRYSDILNFKKLKPFRISDFTASTASDVVPLRRL